MEKLLLVSVVFPASHWNCCENTSQEVCAVTAATTTALKSKSSPKQYWATRGGTEKNSDLTEGQLHWSGGCQWWGLQLTDADCTWIGCQWPGAVGLSFSAQSDLNYLSSSYLPHFKQEGKVLQWESLWGAQGGETLPGRTSGAGGRAGAWEGEMWAGPGKLWFRGIQVLGVVGLGAWDSAWS